MLAKKKLCKSGVSATEASTFSTCLGSLQCLLSNLALSQSSVERKTSSKDRAAQESCIRGVTAGLLLRQQPRICGELQLTSSITVATATVAWPQVGCACQAHCSQLQCQCVHLAGLYVLSQDK